MDGRDQPDTDVVRIRRKGDPSEVERRRLASTIFADEDDVGTFSRGNLVPPPTDHPTGPPADDPATADPYFENLQRTRGGHRESATAARSDSETTAYFDQLTTQSAAEMAATVDAPSVEPAMPGSAQLPAELARPARRRTRRRPPRTNSASTSGRSGVPRMRSLRGPSIPRLVRPAILATLAATLAGGVAFAAILAGHEQPRPHAPYTRARASSQPPAFAELQTAFTAIRRQASAGAIAAHKAADQRTAGRRPTRRHRSNLQRSRPAASSGTHLTLAADHVPAPNPQTITTTPAATGEEIATSGTTEPQQRQQPSSHAAASNQSASPPAGPSGLGQVVGKNCDPKCK
jgi:hypothetical protein